jgi:DNA modification methylase
MEAKIIEGDCAEVLPELPDSCANMVVLDPPHDQWESAAIVFDSLRRLCPSGFIVCFCRIHDLSDILCWAKNYGIAYFDSYVWHDPQPSFVHASRALRTHEHIVVLKSGDPEFPNMKLGERNKDTSPRQKGKSALGKWKGGERVYTPNEFKHLTSVLSYPRPLNGPLGRWQKPDELMRVLVKAYCHANGSVLDPFAGSGTTGVVAIQEGRRSVLIESSAANVETIKRRIADTTPDLLAQFAA